MGTHPLTATMSESTDVSFVASFPDWITALGIIFVPISAIIVRPSPSRRAHLAITQPWVVPPKIANLEVLSAGISDGAQQVSRR